MWVADDGSYGNGEIAVVNASEWSEDEWAFFDESPDWQKLDVARQIEEGRAGRV